MCRPKYNWASFENITWWKKNLKHSKFTQFRPCPRKCDWGGQIAFYSQQDIRCTFASRNIVLGTQARCYTIISIKRGNIWKFENNSRLREMHPLPRCFFQQWLRVTCIYESSLVVCKVHLTCESCIWYVYMSTLMRCLDIVESLLDCLSWHYNK